MPDLFKTLTLLGLTYLLMSYSFAQEGTQEEAKAQVNSPSEFRQCTDCQSYFHNQEQFAFGEAPHLRGAAPWRTHSVLIFQGGEIVSERYSKETAQNKPHRLWSMTKSISSLLIGIRQQEGGLSLHDPLSKFYPQLLNRPDKRTLTLKHLLTMTSGIDWQEVYEDNPLKSDVIRMLYLKENKDMANFVLTHGQRYRPGEYFSYSSGETNLLMGALKESFSTLEEYQAYPWQKLFSPLNIESAQWETDHAGTFVGSSYLYMTARDLSKIGKLILDQGQYSSPNDAEAEARTLISADYLRQSFLPANASCTTKPEAHSAAFSYGYSWWLNAPCPERPHRKKAFAQLPDDLILALGHHGQTMAIFPSQNAVAVRFGADKKGRFDREKWLEAVYENLNTFIKQQRQSSL